MYKSLQLDVKKYRVKMLRVLVVDQVSDIEPNFSKVEIAIKKFRSKYYGKMTPNQKGIESSNISRYIFFDLIAEG